jgi:hypothetical protein
LAARGAAARFAGVGDHNSGTGSGISSIPPAGACADAGGMAMFLLEHLHQPDECAVAFAAWKGFDSPLRRRAVLCSCRSGGHRLWFVVTAATAETALLQLPRYVAARTHAIDVGEVTIP